MRIAVKLERACRVQLLAEWAGGPKFVADAGLEDKNKRGRRTDPVVRQALADAHTRERLLDLLALPVGGRSAERMLVEVVTGLTPNDMVVTDGQMKLKDGAPVMVLPAMVTSWMLPASTSESSCEKLISLPRTCTPGLWNRLNNATSKRPMKTLASLRYGLCNDLG